MERKKFEVKNGISENGRRKRSKSATVPHPHKLLFPHVIIQKDEHTSRSLRPEKPLKLVSCATLGISRFYTRTILILWISRETFFFFFILRAVLLSRAQIAKYETSRCRFGEVKSDWFVQFIIFYFPSSQVSLERGCLLRDESGGFRWNPLFGVA